MTVTNWGGSINHKTLILKYRFALKLNYKFKKLKYLQKTVIIGSS